jgi:hypothetical protein
MEITTVRTWAEQVWQLPSVQIRGTTMSQEKQDIETKFSGYNLKVNVTPHMSMLQSFIHAECAVTVINKIYAPIFLCMRHTPTLNARGRNYEFVYKEANFL